MLEDALSSNAPHIRQLQKHKLRFILGAKPGDHKALFAHLQQAAEEGLTTELECLDPKDSKTAHFFKYLNQVPPEQVQPGSARQCAGVFANR